MPRRANIWLAAAAVASGGAFGEFENVAGRVEELRLEAFWPVDEPSRLAWESIMAS